VAAYAPMDTEVRAAPGRGPGTPVALSASAALRDAVARFDAGDRSTVPAIVSATGPADAVRAGDRAAIARWRDALIERWMCDGCAQPVEAVSAAAARMR
jgi:hypothetical protein